MSRVKVTCEVRVYEHDGKEVDAFKVPPLVVRSHWNWDRFVVLELGAQTFTVNADDLSAAMRSARP